MSLLYTLCLLCTVFPVYTLGFLCTHCLLPMDWVPCVCLHNVLPVYTLGFCVCIGFLCMHCVSCVHILFPVYTLGFLFTYWFLVLVSVYALCLYTHCVTCVHIVSPLYTLGLFVYTLGFVCVHIPLIFYSDSVHSLYFKLTSV